MFGIKTRLVRLGRRLWREYLSPDPRDRILPPPELVYVGVGDFKKIGQRHLRYFIDYCGLAPDHRVLDVGCGVGRIAIPLTQYLNQAGSYVGFDIIESAVQWCQVGITPRYPNFRFDFFDLYNGGYNTSAAQQACAFRFPYESEEFDFVCVVSVFTHLLFPDTENYLAEINRVLKPGGRLFASYYLYDDEAAALVAQGRSSLPFRHRAGPVLIVKPEEPEYAVAYEPQVLRELYQRLGLMIDGPIRKGYWCDRRVAEDYQDLIVALKPH